MIVILFSCKSVTEQSLNPFALYVLFAFLWRICKAQDSFLAWYVRVIFLGSSTESVLQKFRKSFSLRFYKKGGGSHSKDEDEEDKDPPPPHESPPPETRLTPPLTKEDSSEKFRFVRCFEFETTSKFQILLI